MMDVEANCQCCDCERKERYYGGTGEFEEHSVCLA